MSGHRERGSVSGCAVRTERGNVCKSAVATSAKLRSFN